MFDTAEDGVAVQAMRMTPGREVEPTARWVVERLIASQAEDGYLGPFKKEERLGAAAAQPVPTTTAPAVRADVPLWTRIVVAAEAFTPAAIIGLIVLFTFLLAMGLFAFRDMDINLNPDITSPAASVSISQPAESLAAPPGRA